MIPNTNNEVGLQRWILVRVWIDDTHDPILQSENV